MEGDRNSGRWNKKASFVRILLLMCMFIPTLTSLQSSEEPKCSSEEYHNEEKGICCNKCIPGHKLLGECQAKGHRSNCTKCPPGQYIENPNYSYNCFSCKKCKGQKHQVVESACISTRNTICSCDINFYKSEIDTETFDCLKCKQCGPNEKKKQACTPERDTVCECKENYYALNNKCLPCSNCTSDCKRLCPGLYFLNTTAPSKENGYFIQLIVGVAAVAIILLVLVFFATYLTTKRLTQRRLQERTSQPSDAYPESLEVLVQNEEPSHKALKAIPQSPANEQEPSNLPDCVPLEIKISDLIYLVLDLVPVLQVKQLVRSLGVTDKEIERAEMDHRSCQEAHYQMLRVWAERGSRAGGGGRGGMLHRLFLLELLDKLRKMHLGQAAEELETKYDIQ